MKHFNVEKVVEKVRKSLLEAHSDNPSQNETIFKMTDPVYLEMIRLLYTSQNMNVDAPEMISALGCMIGSFVRGAFAKCDDGFDDEDKRNVTEVIKHLHDAALGVALADAKALVKVDIGAPTKAGRA